MFKIINKENKSSKYLSWESGKEAEEGFDRMIGTNKYLQAFTNRPGVRRHGYAANLVAMTLSRWLPFCSKKV